jgi:hypothetical protein
MRHRVPCLPQFTHNFSLSLDGVSPPQQHPGWLSSHHVAFSRRRQLVSRVGLTARKFLHDEGP